MDSADIAVIGVSARFAGAPDRATFWENILAGVDAVHDASDRWSSPYFDPNSKANNRIYTRRGGFLGDTIDFSPSEFGIVPNTVASADIDHFLALQHARDALADAGYLDREFDRSKTGIILGRGTYIGRSNTTLLQHGQALDQIGEVVKALFPEAAPATIDLLKTKLQATLPAFAGETVPGLVPNVITGRIANRLDLMGPNYIIDAACASSLIAIASAVQELRSGRCDMMLTGAVHGTTPPQLYMMFCQLNGMAHGSLRPFQSGTDGTLLGEGVGVLVLKRLADAEAAGDRIYGIIKGVGTSSDGRGVGPAGAARRRPAGGARRRLRGCQVEPGSVELIEAHGTGMPLGDKTEIDTLRQIFGDRHGAGPNVAVGSVKSMIGHCIPAAGVAGTIKALMALQDKVLPPTLCDEVDPGLGIEATNLYVNNRARPWIYAPGLGPRRAAVNAFGFGGVNAHLVLEEYRGPNPAAASHVNWPSELLLLSAADRPGLVEEIARLRAWLTDRPELRLADLAYTLSQRPPGPHRLALVCRDTAECLSKLTQAAEALGGAGQPKFRPSAGILHGAARPRTEQGGVAFMFPGEGGQHEDMLLDLCLHLPGVRAWFDLLDEALSDCPVPPSRVIFPAPNSLTEEARRQLEEYRNSLEYGSASVFIAAMAIHELLTRCGVTCDVMVGHSSGDDTALVASGILKQAGRDELVAGLARFNRACRELTAGEHIERGTLLTVGGIDPARVTQFVEASGGKLHLALDNCPNQMVIFGTGEDIEAAAAALKADGAVCISLPFDRAYHTPLLSDLAPRLRPIYDQQEVGPGTVPVVSCATAAPYPDDPEGVRELATRQWFACVRFRETILKLHDEGIRTFIEVGPGGKLVGFVRDILKGRPQTALASNVPGKSALLQVQLVLASRFVGGTDIDLAPLFEHRPVTRLDPDALPRPVKTGMTIALDTVMPVMRLDAAAAREIGAALWASMAPPPPPVARTDAPALAEAVPVQTVSPAAAPVQSAAAAAPAPAAPIEAPREAVLADARLTMVQSHFSLMNEFLASQARTMERLTGAASGRAGMPAAPAAAAPAAPSPGPVAELEGPLLGNVVEQSATRLVAERHLDVGRDAFLRDHTFGSDPSEFDPGLMGLPVVPFTVSMELVAEAADKLAGPQSKVIGLHNMRGLRWLALDNGALTLTTEAELSADRREAKVRVFAGERGSRTPADIAFEGVARLAMDYPAAPALEPFDIGRPQPVNYAADTLYGETRPENAHRATLFHGPAFQAVTGIRRVGSGGLEADMSVLPATPFGVDHRRTVLQIDPAVLDAASHLIGYWVAERFAVDLSFFPFACREYRQYGPWPGAGSRIVCQASIRLATPVGDGAALEFLDKAGKPLLRLDAASASPEAPPPGYETCRLTPASAWIEANFRFIDNDGILLAQLDGWSDRYFSISHRFYRSRLWPRREFVSEPVSDAPGGAVIRRIDREREAYLDQGGGIWKRVLAHLTLSRRERRRWYELPKQGERQTEWLLGRVAAKDAVRQWARERHGIEIAPADIEILPDQFGRPVVECPALQGRAMPAVSISHDRAAVLGIAAEADERIGIDHANLREERAFEMLEIGFTPAELALLAAGEPAERGIDLLRFWCGKEAAAKASGGGLQGDPRKWSVVRYDTATGKLIVTYEGAAFAVDTWLIDGEVVALCRIAAVAQPVIVHAA